ncbi:MAG: CvpA family protein [Bacteroidota bacterium]|nr:CvpA family protein [Bacteroidota bacterium]
MNTLDIIILIIILIPALLGLKNGMLRSIFSLAGIIAGLFLATRYNEKLTDIFGFIKIEPKLLSLISFIGIIVFVYFIAVYIARKISGLNAATKTIDKILGVGLGIFKGLILASIFLLITTNTLNLFNKEDVSNSKFYSSIINVAPDVYNYIKQLFPNAKDFYDEFNHLSFTSLK